MMKAEAGSSGRDEERSAGKRRKWENIKVGMGAMTGLIRAQDQGRGDREGFQLME